MSKNTSVPLYQHVRAELVSPRIKALAAGWQVWNSEQEGNGETFHIDYDGDYGSERVLIVSGRADEFCAIVYPTRPEYDKSQMRMA